MSTSGPLAGPRAARGRGFGAGRHFLSLKWKAFLAISLALLLTNAGIAWLVFVRATAHFDEQQRDRQALQARQLEVVLAQGFQAMSTFASFIPQLSVPGAVDEPGLARRLGSVLDEHGVLLEVEWGIEGIHYFAAEKPATALVSWPAGRSAPQLAGLLEQARREEAPQGRLVCAGGCVQVVALPLLERGRTVGFLAVERSIGDSLHDFHRLSGADLVLLERRPALAAGGGPRWLAPWGRAVSSITHPQPVLPILGTVAARFGLSELHVRPRRLQRGGEWYEVSAVSAAPAYPAIDVLVVNRVTAQVQAIRAATGDSLLLAVAGLVFSGVVLMLLLWSPMRRIQDAVQALPLLAEKSYAQLREHLPPRPPERVPRDEIDVMIEVIGRVAGQIEQLDQAHSAAERALRDSEQGLKLAQSMARVASWQGRPLDGTFEVTQGAARIDPALAAVQTWEEFLDLVHPADRSRLRIAWRQGRIGGQMDIEFRLQIGHREIDIHAMARFDAVDPTRILYAAGMLQDVTEMRIVQRALRRHRDRLEDEVLERTAELVAARNDAERLAQVKGRFLANMSHEIRTPLNAILGLSQVGLQQDHGRTAAETFTQIRDAGEHLLKVVNDVLDISKLEAGTLTIEQRPFDLRKAISQPAAMLEQHMQAKSLRLLVTLAEDLPPCVLGDGFRLQQILINLLGNAVKFTEQGSVSLDVYREHGLYCFRVTDTGIGMSRGQIGRLFTPFQQLEDNPVQRREGTGLGLCISNTLATLMGGDIHVSSERGVGSKFVLRLPLQALEATGATVTEPATPAAARRPRLAGLCALVADDVAINRTVLQALLEKEGARVVVAVDGAAAVEAVLRESARLDVVLMDVEMPQLDGRQATRRIRAAGLDVAIIGVTAHAGAEERAVSLAAGMDDQLIKPILQDELVHRVLRHRRRGAPRPLPQKTA